MRSVWKQSVTVFLAMAVLMLPTPPSAAAKGNPDLAKGIKLLDDAEDEKALSSFKKALARPKNTKKIRAKIHLYLGITHFNLLHEKDAAKHFRKAVRLRPKITAPAGVSPKTSEFLEGVRKKESKKRKKARKKRRKKKIPMTPRPSPKPRKSTGWYWPALAVLGVGVAAGGTGLALGLVSRSKQDEANGLDVPFSEAEKIHDKAKTFALTANIMFGVAGAAAITSGVLFYLGYRKKDAPVATVVPMRNGAVVQVHGIRF